MPNSKQGIHRNKNSMSTAAAKKAQGAARSILGNIVVPTKKAGDSPVSGAALFSSPSAISAVKSGFHKHKTKAGTLFADKKKVADKISIQGLDGKKSNFEKLVPFYVKQPKGGISIVYPEGSTLPATLKRKYSVPKDVKDLIKSNTGRDYKHNTNPYSFLAEDLFEDISAMMFDWSSEVTPYMDEWIRIKEQYKLGTSTQKPDQCEGGKYAESKLLFKLVNKVLQKLNVTDFDITLKAKLSDIDLVVDKIVENTLKNKNVVKQFVQEFGAKSQEEIEAVLQEIKRGIGSRDFIKFILKEGLGLIFKEMGLRNAFLDSDNGTYMSALKYGTGFMYIEKTNTGDMPIQFKNIPINKIAFDTNVNSLRNTNKNKVGRRCFITFDYSTLEEAKKDYPDSAHILDEYTTWGNLPFTKLDSMDKLKDNRLKGQIGWYIDIDEKIFIIIGGADASILLDMSGDSFPFVMDGDPYVPVIMTYIFDNEDWIYKKGVGHYASQLNNIDSILRNITINRFIQDNAPIDIINIADGYEAEMKKKINNAHKEALAKGRGTVINSVDDSGDGQLLGVTALSNSSQWGMEKKQMLDQDINGDIIGMGINMNEVNDNPYKTAEAVQNEASVINSIIENMEMVNEREFVFLIKIVLSMINKIKDDIAIPTDKWNTINKSVQFVMQPTMKTLKIILKELDVSITTKFSNGIKPVDLSRSRVLMNNLQFIPPNSKAQLKTIAELLRLSNIEVTEEELTPTQAPEVQIQERRQAPQ